MNSEIKILVAFINNALNSKMVLSKLSVSMNSLTFLTFHGKLSRSKQKGKRRFDTKYNWIRLQGHTAVAQKRVLAFMLTTSFIP